MCKNKQVTLLLRELSIIAQHVLDSEEPDNVARIMATMIKQIEKAIQNDLTKYREEFS